LVQGSRRSAQRPARSAVSPLHPLADHPTAPDVIDAALRIGQDQPETYTEVLFRSAVVVTPLSKACQAVFFQASATGWSDDTPGGVAA
jgi:hypothetical protein